MSQTGRPRLACRALRRSGRGPNGRTSVAGGRVDVSASMRAMGNAHPMSGRSARPPTAAGSGPAEAEVRSDTQPTYDDRLMIDAPTGGGRARGVTRLW